MQRDKIKVEIKKLSHGKSLPLPCYATMQSAGMDLYAALDDSVILNPLERLLIPSGLAAKTASGAKSEVEDTQYGFESATAVPITYRESVGAIEDNPRIDDPRVAVIVLLNSARYLKTPELMEASQVCSLWESLLSRKVFWQTIKLDGCSKENFKNLARIAKSKGCKTLELEGIDRTYIKTYTSYWDEFFRQMQIVDTVTELKMGLCKPDVLTLFDEHSFGKTIQTLVIDLMYGFCYMEPEVLSRSLNCLVNLKRLSLIVSGLSCTVDTEKILAAIVDHKTLTDLEIHNFIIMEDFSSQMRKCTNLRRFTLIPDTFGQRYQVIINGVKQLRNTLEYFRLGINKLQLVYSEAEVKKLSQHGCSVTREDREDIGTSVRLCMKCLCCASAICDKTHYHLYGLKTLKNMFLKDLHKMDADYYFFSPMKDLNDSL